MEPRVIKKSPLAPPFGYAQGMLFQRGEVAVDKENYARYFFDHPPLKKGKP
jgi:hypothetical protein